MKFSGFSSLAGVVLAACLGNPMAVAAPAQGCAAPEPQVLRTTWQAFRNATLAGKPEQVGKFYKFPLKLRSPMDGDPSLKITRPVFMANYEQLFRQGPADSEIGLLTAMKKYTGNEYIPAPSFDPARCTGSVRIEDYQFVYDKAGGWRVDSLFYNEDYSVARDAGLDKVQ